MSTSRQVLLKKTALLPDMTASSSFISPPSRPVPRRSRSVHSQAQLQEGACLSLADELFGVVAALRRVSPSSSARFTFPHIGAPRSKRSTHSTRTTTPQPRLTWASHAPSHFGRTLHSLECPFLDLSQPLHRVLPLDRLASLRARRTSAGLSMRRLKSLLFSYSPLSRLLGIPFVRRRRPEPFQQCPRDLFVSFLFCLGGLDGICDVFPNT